MRIETERLILRPFEEQDAAALKPLLGDPEVMAFSDAGPLGEEARADWLQRARENPAMLAILARAQMRLVGYIGLTVSPDRIRPGEIELGFRLMRAVWGQGLATEAAWAVLSAGQGVGRNVVALVDPGNVRSVAVLRKLGFVRLRDAMLEGYDHPDHVYGRPAGALVEL